MLHDYITGIECRGTSRSSQHNVIGKSEYVSLMGNFKFSSSITSIVELHTFDPP
jgi:hypothetical protein